MEYTVIRCSFNDSLRRGNYSRVTATQQHKHNVDRGHKKQKYKIRITIIYKIETTSEDYLILKLGLRYDLITEMDTLGLIEWNRLVKNNLTEL